MERSDHEVISGMLIQLDRYVKDQMEFSRMQSEVNRYFLNFIKNANGEK
jgi:hypothetical protein